MKIRQENVVQSQIMYVTFVDFLIDWILRNKVITTSKIKQFLEIRF